MGSNKYGAVFTQTGVPIKGSAEYQRVLDSRWKFMEIEQSVRINVPIAAVGFGDPYLLIKLVDHNLGYLPAFFSTAQDQGVNNPIAFSTDKAIYYNVSPGTPAGNIVGWVHIFNVDIQQLYKAEYFKPSNKPDTVSNRGAKFLEDGSKKKLNDEGAEGFSVNTRAKALSIHMTGPYAIDGAGASPTLDHGLGYFPTSMIARLQASGHVAFNPTTSTVITPLSYPLRATVTNTTIKFGGVQSVATGNYAYIILKDPAEIVA